MLDRFGLLINLLESVSPGTQKRASEENEFDFPLYVPSVKRAPKAKTPPVPPPVVEAPAAPVAAPPVATPPPAAPLAVAPEVTPPVPPPAPVKAFPSWVDPTWKPIQKFKSHEPKKFDISHWGTLDDFDDEEPAKVETKPVTVEPTPAPTPAPAPETKTPALEPEPEPEPEVTMSAVEAKSYLESLPEDDRLADALEAFDKGNDEINSSPKDKRLHATVLALLSAHFFGLKEHADDVFKENKVQGLIAVKAILDQLSERISRLPKKMQERAQDKIGKLTGTAEAKLRPLTSQFYGPELIFVNNRAIKLMISRGISVDEAEKEAQAEWEALDQLANGLIPDNPAARSQLLRKGALSFIDTGNFQDAKRDMVVYADAFAAGGLDSLGENDQLSYMSSLFPDVHIDPEEEYEYLAEDFVNGTFDLEEFQQIPEADRDRLMELISKYGKLALRFSKLQELIRQNSGRDQDKENEYKETIQTVYDKIRNLSIDIFTLNGKYIKMAYETFKDLYIVDKTIEALAHNEGLESIPITVSQSAGEGLAVKDPGIRNTNNIINPRLKRIDETQEDYAKRQARENEMADASRQRYLQRILERGDSSGYLDRKRLYQVERRKTKQERELARIRNPEYARTNKEKVKWRQLATTNADSSDLLAGVQWLIKDQKSRTEDLLKRLSESWLPKEELAEMENSLMNVRIKSFQDEYDAIKNLDGIQPQVLQAFEFMISNIPMYFEESKEKVHAEKVSSARITLDMVSTFMKCASRQEPL